MVDKEIIKAIVDASSQFHIEPEFMLAICGAESNFDPNALSTANAKGLFQFIPQTFSWACDQVMKLGLISSINPYNIKTSTMCGGWYIDYLGRKFNENKILIMIAYNWGEGRLRNYLSGKLHILEPTSPIKAIMVKLFQPMCWKFMLLPEILLYLPQETINYIRKVMGFYEKYKSLRNEINWGLTEPIT